MFINGPSVWAALLHENEAGVLPNLPITLFMPGAVVSGELITEDEYATRMVNGVRAGLNFDPVPTILAHAEPEVEIAPMYFLDNARLVSVSPPVSLGLWCGLSTNVSGFAIPAAWSHALP